MKKLGLVFLSIVSWVILWLLISGVFGEIGISQDKVDGSRLERTAFIRNLYKKEKADFGDACFVIANLTKSKEATGPFKKLRDELIKEEIIPKKWTYKKDSPLTKGMISYMLCKTLKIKGGLTMRVFGATERYALRECLYIGLVVKGESTSQYVSGKELLAIFSRASIYKREGSLKSLTE